jgi:site-specific recombinase XerC
MNDLVQITAPQALPTLVAAAGERAQVRFLEFFAATIRNGNTRRAYARAVVDFLAWCEGRGATSLAGVQPLHVGAYIEGLSLARSAPTAKQHLAAIRHLFDWLVMGQVVPLNPAASVRGPSHSVRRGKTPVLDPTEARQLLDAIDISTPVGLRDRALLGLMVFSFARIGAALGMKVEDVYVQNRRLWVRLHEKGGKIVQSIQHRRQNSESLRLQRLELGLVIQKTLRTKVRLEGHMHLAGQVAEQLSEFVAGKRIRAAVAEICLGRHVRKIGQDRCGLRQNLSIVELQGWHLSARIDGEVTHRRI